MCGGGGGGRHVIVASQETLWRSWQSHRCARAPRGLVSVEPKGTTVTHSFTSKPRSCILKRRVSGKGSWFLWGYPSWVFFLQRKQIPPLPRRRVERNEGMLQSARPYPSGVYTMCHACANSGRGRVGNAS